MEGGREEPQNSCLFYRREFVNTFHIEISKIMFKIREDENYDDDKLILF